MKNVRLSFIVFSILFAQSITAMESASNGKKGLYLIVGSTRAAGDVGWWWNKMQGKGTNFDHLTTFGGKATTLDLGLSKVLKAPHFRKDATTFKPKTKIQHLFFELFPSAGGKQNRKMGTQVDDNSNLAQTVDNLLLFPNALINLSKFMTSGAQLEIEHNPHVGALYKELYADSYQSFKAANPFHCFVSPYYLHALRARNIDIKENPEIYTEYWDKIISSEDARYKDAILEAAFNLPYLKNAIDLVTKFSGLTAEFIEQRIESEILLCENDGWYQFVSKNGPNSLIVALASMAAVSEMTPLIVDFLEKNGFEQVKVEILETNHYNGRRNVFWISAVHK